MASHHSISLSPLVLIRVAGLPLRWLEAISAKWPSEEAADDWVAERVRECFDAALHALDTSTIRTAVYNARRDFFAKKKTPSAAFFQLLIENQHEPAIAQLLENLLRWEEKAKALDAFDQRYEQVLKDNYRLMQEAANEENLRRALLFASHDLLHCLPEFSQCPLDRLNKKSRQTALSLYQYLTRAVVKTSPLSRFTTVALWQHGPQAAVTFGKAQATPNVAILPALYEMLLREPAFYESLQLALNPSIVRMATNTRWTWLYFDGEQESFQKLEGDPIAGLIVEWLLEQGGKMPYSDLLSRLEGKVDAARAQVATRVSDLIDYGLLEWELPEKGLSPAWCGALYNFLGFLPAHTPLLVDAAAFLQWMRVAARSLPHQPLEDARVMQHETLVMASVFFEKYGGSFPAIPPEQIFFEDVTQSVESNVPLEVMETLAKDLTTYWQANKASVLSPFRARLVAFAQRNMADGQCVGFLDFCERFFASNTATSENRAERCAQDFVGKMGALLQVFRNDSGDFSAVVNALFAGGGKMFARWLHLFPAEATSQLQHWNVGGAKGAGFDEEVLTVAFPWQGWSNANFQPALFHNALAVPDGRTNPIRDGRMVLLGNLEVRWEAGCLQLIDRESNKPIVFSDLGLEAPETRPPAMQVLWHLGMPQISLERLLAHRRWAEGGAGWRVAERVAHGSLFVARKMWNIEDVLLERWRFEQRESRFFRLVRKELSDMEVPQRFFGRLSHGKPQYFDVNSPLSMQLFAKMLRNQRGSLLVTEMLPMPEQCVVEQEGARAAEFVVEFQ
ncbi:MAG: lantibiotic dehydratase [Saprospiraceae bacterium]|nr:lantibiotic dehydratase [Saprospiraceae bacterium]